MTDFHKRRALSMQDAYISKDEIRAPMSEVETQAHAIREARIQMQVGQFFANEADRVETIAIARDILEKAGLDPDMVYCLEDAELAAKQAKHLREMQAREPGDADAYGTGDSGALRAWNADRRQEA